MHNRPNKYLNKRKTVYKEGNKAPTRYIPATG